MVVSVEKLEAVAGVIKSCKNAAGRGLRLKLKARNFPDQKTEARIGTSILNVSKGQREPHVQHNYEADDLG
jgi:hypothetical protein